MEIGGLLLTGSLISAGTLFFWGLYYSVKSDKKWTKFMAFALLNLAITSVALLHFGSDHILNTRDLIIAASIFVILSALFYLTYFLVKRGP